MSIFKKKYEVQKGRTVTCKMGVAHEGAVLTLENFSGNDKESKQKLIDTFVGIKALKEIPLTDDEKKIIAKARAEQEEAERKAIEVAESKARAERQMDVILSADFDKMVIDKARSEQEKKEAILSADFDKMNKDPMIEFAGNWGVELNGSKADEIREELKGIQNLLLETEGNK